MGKVRPSPARWLPRRDQDLWGDSPISLPHWMVGPQPAGLSTHGKHLVNRGWNELAFRGALPRHLLTTGNSLSRATFRRASSSSGSLRACKEMGRGAKAAWKKMQRYRQPTHHLHLHPPNPGLHNKPQTGHLSGE